MEYKRHPRSAIYPEIVGPEFDKLVVSMQDNGFDPEFPILLFADQIVDGWNRYRAAREAGVEPVFKHWQGAFNELLPFVIRANSTRRHLSKAAEAQALIKAAQFQPISERMTSEEIAAQTGVSLKIVEEQQQLRTESPEMADAVAAGETTATAAVRRALKKRKVRGRMVMVGIQATIYDQIVEAAGDMGETPYQYVREAVKARLEAQAGSYFV